MIIIELVFYFASAMLVASALGVVGARNPVHSALFLVLCFFCCSVIWLLLEAEFLAIALVLVYVGAVMVLFLFVVMMLDINLTVLREGFVRYIPVGTLIALIVAAQMVWVVGPVGEDTFGEAGFAIPAGHPADYSNTQELGRVLYTEYVYPFEIAAVVLLVAIVAAISLTFRRRKNTRYQDPGKQVQVTKSDRLRIIKMDAEKES